MRAIKALNPDVVFVATYPANSSGMINAAQEVGLASVPVRVVDFNDQQVMEAALIENIQRTDLNPIEKAQGFQQYLAQYGVTQDELAKRMGLDRSTVSNFIRLLELPPAVQDAVRTGQITNGHARARASRCRSCRCCGSTGSRHCPTNRCS